MNGLSMNGVLSRDNAMKTMKVILLFIFLNTVSAKLCCDKECVGRQDYIIILTLKCLLIY